MTTTPTLTIHHLAASSSERIPWLCEELSIPYTLKVYPRDPQTNLATPEYKSLHPGGSAPVINDLTNNLTLSESGACIHYIATTHHLLPPNNNNKPPLFPSPTNPIYPTFLYWFHWSNATFQASLTRSLALKSSSTPSKMATITAARVSKSLHLLNTQLSTTTYLCGTHLTAADIMLVFSLTTFRYWHPYSLSEYPHIVAYLSRIGKREAYRRAMEKSDPGMELVLGGEAPIAKW